MPWRLQLSEKFDLFTTHSGIDIIAVRGCRRERGTRLVRLRRQLYRREPRQDVAGVHVRAFLDRNRHELAVHLRLHPDFGRPHDADNRGGRCGTLGANQNARDEHERDRNDGGTPGFTHVPVLS